MVGAIIATIIIGIATMTMVWKVKMAPMEFAVVRNNVYKLAVTNISRLGHPRISDNDPDNPGPDTPDERGDIYLTVSVDVLPWVVRVNNIDF